MIIANPILKGMNPDPSACQVGVTTYVVTSTFTWLPGLPIYRSDNLVDWEIAGHAVVDPAVLGLNEAAESGGLFAPTLRYIQGKFFLVCTSVVADDERSFVIHATDPAGPWSEPIILEGVGGIDPDIFEDVDGTIWWTGTRLAEDPLWPSQTEIWTRPIDLMSGKFLAEETVIWHGAVEGVVWSEAPHIYLVAGTYYLLTAEGGTAEEHSVSVARSSSVTGPWEGSKRNPIFTHRNHGKDFEVQFVGHADLFQRSDGQWWAVMLGVRMRDSHHLLGRETFLCPVAWEEGWPVFSPGLGQLPARIDINEGGYTLLEPFSTDPYPARQEPKTTDTGSFVSMGVFPVGREWSDLDRFVGTRIAEWCAGMSIDAEALSQGGGIGIVQDAFNWIRVARDGNAIVVCTCVKGESETTELLRLGEGIRISLELQDLDVVARGGAKTLKIDARPLSTQEAGGFTGCVIGVFEPEALDPSAKIELYGTFK